MPRVQSRRDSGGNIVSTSLEDMFPHLDHAEVKEIKREVNNI